MLVKSLGYWIHLFKHVDLTHFEFEKHWFSVACSNIYIIDSSEFQLIFSLDKWFEVEYCIYAILVIICKAHCPNSLKVTGIAFRCLQIHFITFCLLYLYISSLTYLNLHWFGHIISHWWQSSIYGKVVKRNFHIYK